MTMIIDKPGFYKLQDGGKVECEHVGKDYAVVRTYTGSVYLYALDGRSPAHLWPDIISPWVDPPKPLELWVNEYKTHVNAYFHKETAIENAHGVELRIAVHMREVTE